MAKTQQKSDSIMNNLLQDGPKILRIRPGELVEGTVVFKGKNKLLVDIGGVTTGIISGRELRDSFHTFKELSIGDTVMSMVLEEENDEGMYVLSLRMASQQKAWEKFHKLIEDEGTMKFTAQEANKGGLLSNIDGIRTFLPVSQLAPSHYPRVNNADQSEIIHRLQKYVNFTFTVKIITMDEEAGKIVVSEREAMSEERAKSLESLGIGSSKDGMVTGVVKFGLFVAFDGLEGLVHISEIAWGHVKNPAEHAEVGDKVKVKIIGIDGDKLSLSIKQLTKDPWEEIAERYPVGKKVSGTVVRFAEYGAFVKLEKDINGLIHLTELSHHKIEDPSEVITIGKKVEAQVINIDIDERRIGLSLKALQPIDAATLAKIKAEQEAEEEKEGKEEEEEKPKKKKAKEAKEAKEAEDSEKSEEAKDNKDKEVKTKPLAHPSPLRQGSEGQAAGAEKKEVKKDDNKESGFVASKSGKKYYSAESPQGKKIKEENRVVFSTEKEAEKAGYSA